jgi:hypothetical protein
MDIGKKWKPLVIFKGKRSPAPADIPNDIKVQMTANGWMNEITVGRWV